MFYPKNFPLKMEKPVIKFLQRLEQEFVKKNPKTRKEFQQTVRLILSQKDFSVPLHGKIPPIWWLNFILIRHEKLFASFFVQCIQKFLMKTKTRSISGIVPLTLFLKEQFCPFHCVYCPTEPGIPKGYFSDEPAVMRAIRNKFDPYLQAENRLVMLALSNHAIDKVELIIKGGTFSAYSKAYREKFVKQVFDACNSNVQSLIKTGRRRKKKSARDLYQAQKINEKAKSRIVGFNIETRSDFINDEEVRFLRKLGVAHVELGVQVLDDKVLKLVRRGHTVRKIKEATLLLKETGFKIGYHLMPNLPTLTPNQDFEMLKKVFEEDFNPDYLKIYPTTVTNFSELAQWYKSGIYKPYSNEALVAVMAKFKSEIIPPWVRIGRLTRDITVNMMPGPLIPSNLRETIQAELARRGKMCQCIRCREIRDVEVAGEPELRVLQYKASQAEEYFLEFIDNVEHSLGFLRLRIPIYLLNGTQPTFPILKHAALVRELHVFGRAIPIGQTNNSSTQHRRLGTKLLQKAEEIVLNLGIFRLAIISGVGARGYYRKFGYRLSETYMVKNLIK